MKIKSLLKLVLGGFLIQTAPGHPQSSKEPIPPGLSEEYPENFKAHIRSLGRFSNTSKSAGEAWFNYAFAMDDFNGGLSVASGNPLFPDTTIAYLFGTSWSKPWVHRVMNIFHPAALTPFLNEAGQVGLDLNPSMSYYIDSVGLFCTYRRKLPANVTDTLILDFVYDAPRYYISSTNTLNNFGADTIHFLDIRFSNPPSEVLDPAQTQRFRITKLLTPAVAADSSSNGVLYLAFNTSSLPPVTPHPLLGTGIVGVSVRFSPGYSWTPHQDTLHSKNVFRILCFEEKGSGTFPSYFKDEYNVSGIFQTSSKFTSSSGWYGLHIPTYARTSASFNLEHLLIEYKVRGVGTSVMSLPDKHIKAWTADRQLNILNESGVPVEGFSLYDASGRCMLRQRQPWIGSLVQDISSLPSGVYFLHVVLQGQPLSLRLVIP
ncbi:MAG: T9SS type A sorting domain-containing protein [Flavobacteriales bacterium]|nr:T9SS type A sorting domain-containing protein [Flavobacteriales bacterium]